MAQETRVFGLLKFGEMLQEYPDEGLGSWYSFDTNLR